MSINYGSILNLALPADGDQSWGAAVRQNFEVLAALSVPTNMYFVSPQFTDANLHHASASAPRFFSTLQAAHDAIAAGGYNGRAVVMVYPGTYAENLTLTKTVTFRAAVPAWYRALGGLRAVELVGSTTSQSPLVTINPPNSTEVVVNFSGFIFENLYNQAAGAIVKAQMIKLNAQTSYGSRQNGLALVDCDLRMQTYGNDNEWYAGVWAQGWNDVNIRRCNMAALSYAGGANNGGIANVIMCVGDDGNGKACQLRVYDSAIAQYYKGTLIPAPSVFYMDNRASGYVAKSAIVRTTTPNFVNGTYKYIGATGTNSIAGTDADSATYGNLLGLDITGL